MASQEDTQEGDANAQLLAEEFQKEGLDAGYWLPKVSHILGIECRESLQHLEYEDYLKLECEVQHHWEKKALQKLLNITDDKTASKELQKEQLEKTKQRQEEAKQALQDLTEMLNSCSHSQDALKEKAETLWRAIEMPKEFWPSPKEPLADMLQSIHKQLEQQQELLAGRRENIPDTEVLRWASGGLALQGIYRTSRAGDVLATREQLLRVPEGFQLAGPEQGSVFERREFSSSAEESTFTKSMEQLGFSMSVSAKSAFLDVNLGAGVDHSSSSQSQDTHQSHSEQSYFCTTKFQYIPLASCYFQRHQLRLSDAALRELQDMEQILGVIGKKDNSTFVKMCESFFSRFGSHINQGPLHFGGIFWWKASTEGFRAEQREEVKRQTSEALNGFVRVSWGGFGANVGVIVDVSISISISSVRGRAGESSHTAIHLYTVNTGGPADTTSLPQWKTGLVSDNTTWCVIDRGFQLIPVWDVILCNHCRDFKSVGQMSRALRDAYKELTNESVGTIFGEELGSAVQEARDFMETVKAWEVTVDERNLLMLMELKDDLNAKTRNHSVWINVCLSHKALQDFLVNTVRSCQESPPENTTSIKIILRSLLDPHIYSVKDFPEASFIMQWIFRNEHLLPRYPKISELEELIQTLQQMKEHIYAATYAPGSSAAAVHEAKIKATLTISLAIYSLLQSLQERAEKHMELLVLLIVTSTGYQMESSTFQHLLGHPEIQYMAKEMEAAHEEYVNLKEQDANRAEASLLLTGLTVTPESQKLSPEQKRERLVFMEDHMKGLWSTRIKNLLEKHSADTDWERLEQDLHSLISGGLDEKWDEQRMQNALGDLEVTFPTPELPSQSQWKSDSSQTKANEAIANQEFLQLKDSLEIAAYRNLESAFIQWTWRLRSHFLDVQMRLNNKIQNGDLQNVTRKYLEGLVQETSDAIEKELEKYFREDKDRETPVQWKSSTELKLKELKENLLHETKKKCENLLELQKEQRKLDARKLEYEDELLRRSRELAVTLKGKSLSERELKDNFALVWNSWIAEVSRASRPPERVDIDAEIEDVLLEHFKEPGFHERIRSFPKDREFSFDVEKHISKKKLLGYILDPRSISSSDVCNFEHITDNIIACVKANINKKEQEKQDYSRNFIHEILNDVQKGVNSVPSNAKYTFNREYSIDLSLYLCKMAAERFKAMHEAFQKANHPAVYLNSKREDFFQCFQISCQGATSITTFAVFLCDKIEPALCKAVFERTAKDIAEDMKNKFPDFRGNRADLEVCILRYLAEEENFEYFKQYLTSPKQFFQHYIATRVKSHCLDGNKRLAMFLESSLESLYRNIQSAVSFSTQIVKDRNDREDKISLWLDEFCKGLTEIINLPRSELKDVEHQEVTDIEFLSSAMAEALADMKDRLKAELADADMSSFSRQPHTILAEHFSGCWEQCPFCGAVCTNTMQNHDGDHQLVFHRPQALKGFTRWKCLHSKWYNTHELIIAICSSHVASDRVFRIDSSHPWTPYKRYRDAGPPVSTWRILPDSSMQAYWKWFVSHFRTQLEDLYNGKFQGEGEIPEAWQRITKQEALSELDRL